MKLEELFFFSLAPDIDYKSFDCGDQGINEFIHTEALDYQNHNLGNTYGFKTKEGRVIAYFTIFNDCIRDLGATNKAMEKFGKRLGVPHPKRLRIRAYPAIKIGRLGMCQDQQGIKDVDGKTLSDYFLTFIKGWTIQNLRPAAKFLILDSYNNEKNIKYYKRNGFELYPTPIKPEDSTVPMYFHIDIING